MALTGLGGGALRRDKSAGQGEPGRRGGVVSGSGGGGLAATPGAGSGGKGVAELSQLRQVETGFVGSAEFVLGKCPPVGFIGQPHNTIQEEAPGNVLLEEMGRQVVGMDERTELGK